MRHVRNYTIGDSWSGRFQSHMQGKNVMQPMGWIGVWFAKPKIDWHINNKSAPAKWTYQQYRRILYGKTPT